jgi:enoyl-CoA hydratase/carnithine racemase
MSEAAVLFERITPHIALVTLNRPDKKNAINGDITQGLSEAITTVESDPELRVAILAANGNVFCAGVDLGEVAAGRGAACNTPTGGFAGFVKEPRTKPWIAAIDGLALGGGFELMLTCEMAVITETSKLGLPEVKRGLMAAAGGVFRVGTSLPRVIANEIVTTGLPLSADRALQYGVVNRVVETGKAIAAATELAEEIASNAPISVVESLKLTKVANDNTESELWEMNTAAMKTVMSSADAKEGPRAFMEKRAPIWQGK